VVVKVKSGMRFVPPLNFRSLIGGDMRPLLCLQVVMLSTRRRRNSWGGKDGAAVTMKSL
jgi:hypothetical protein